MTGHRKQAPRRQTARQSAARKSARRVALTTRGEVAARGEFVRLERFAKDLEGSGSARARQARTAANSARRKLVRQQQETRARVETRRPLRPRKRRSR